MLRIVRQLLPVSILLIAFALRVYNLQNIPSGLFTDEAARGYDAYSISRTGADMFGDYLPLFARGFDDYTPALYTYLTTPFVLLLDLSRFSTRLPSAIIGLLTVAVSYQAIRRPFGRKAGIAGAALIAISPWTVLLSRIGVEWNLLALGPMLTVVLAYRGLRRSSWLIAAGIIGGISLYGYAPVKLFLPLLLMGFAVLYRRELLAQRRATMMATICWFILALPVYIFSFTAEGSIRFQEVSILHNLSPAPAATQFIKNYLSYFSPNFLFITDVSQPNVFFIQRLKNVGLLYWFELPLIILGLIAVIRRGGRDRYFWLYWLLIAPLGINLHIHSPKPALWLTSTPTLHGLAAAGVVFLMDAWQRGFFSEHHLRLQRLFAGAAITGLIIVALFNIRAMLLDLFAEFPIYTAEIADWGYGLDRGVADLAAYQPAFDSATIDTFGPISGIYYAFYTRFPPHQWQNDVQNYGDNAWQRVGPVNVGAIEQRSLQPGCHLTLMQQANRPHIPPTHVRLKTYSLPNGASGPLFLGAIVSPQTERIPVQAVFNQQILLDSFALTSTQLRPGQALCVTLVWQSAGGLDVDATVFVHLVEPANNKLWAQHDSPPVDGQRPTLLWQPDEVIQDTHLLFIPADAPAGPYALNVGLYNSATGQRLPVQVDGQMADHITLVEINVQ